MGKALTAMHWEIGIDADGAELVLVPLHYIPASRRTHQPCNNQQTSQLQKEGDMSMDAGF